MKKSVFENAIASQMDALMKDDEFTSIFNKRLNKTASDQNCAHDCSMAHDHNHKCSEDCASAKDKNEADTNTQPNTKPGAPKPINVGDITKDVRPVPGPNPNQPGMSSADDMEMTKQALLTAVSQLTKVSEVLDEVGLNVTAKLSLNLIDRIVVEAKKKKMDKKDDEKSKKSDKSEMMDSKKKDLKSDKKDMKKSDKKDMESKKDSKKTKSDDVKKK